MIRLNSKTPFTNDDLAWLKDGGYYDPTQADKVISWIEKYCLQSKYPFFGQPIKLLRWQRRFIKRIYGMKNADGTNYVKIAFLYIPKKQGKSTLAACLSLVTLCSIKGSQSIIQAKDEKQAKIIFNEAANMVSQHPILKKRLKVLRSKNRIENRETLSSIEVLSGLPHEGNIVSGLCLVDEISFHRPCYAREVWEQLKYAQVTNPNALKIVCTTAGFNRNNNIGFELFQKGEQILNGVASEKGFLPILYYVPEDEDYTLPENQIKCNPSVGHTISKESLLLDYAQAKDSPIELTTFRQLRLNQWVGFSDYVPSHVWARREADLKESDYIDWFGQIGYDGSKYYDLTSYSIMLRRGEEYVNFSRFFGARTLAYEKGKADGIPYDRWESKGYITLTEGNEIDKSIVREHLLADLAKFPNVKKIVYDAYEFTESSTILREMGIDCVECPQNLATIYQPTSYLEKTIRSGNIISQRNPILSYCFGNVELKRMPDNSIKVEKKRSRGRVDGVTAMILAMAGHLENVQADPFVYFSG